jgi:phage nucleotide-binding protein
MVQTLTVQEALSEIGLKVLVYAPAGAGKTTLAGTLPPPVLVLDFEGGILALMGRPNISVCPVRSGEELLQVVKELQSDTTFKSVVFDGLSIFVKRRVQELRSKERVTWDEWQRLTAEIRTAILPLLHIRKHLLLTALPRWVRQKDERGRENGPIIGAVPDLTPAIRNDLVASCDIVAYLASPNDPLIPSQERKLIIVPPNGVQLLTKSRVPNLTEAPADFSQLLQMLDLPELKPKPSVVPMLTDSKPVFVAERQDEQPTQSAQSAQPTQPERAQETQETELTERDELTSRIFSLARKLNLDTKALGRLAKQHFGDGYIRNLTEDQKRTLIALMEKQLQARTVIGDPVAAFITAWRSYRQDNEEIPFERELAEIAVKREWTIDELESAIAEKLLDRSYTLPSDDNGYWLRQVPEQLLQDIVSELQLESASEVNEM